MSSAEDYVFIFNPAEDSEWPIHDLDDKCESCGLQYRHYYVYRRKGATTESSAGHYCSDCNESYPVKLVFNLEGSRGHYLASAYIEAAMAILKNEDHEYMFTWKRWEELGQCEKDAHNYIAHGGSYCPENKRQFDSDLCSSCEWIHESCDHVESVMTDKGYLTVWSDGVYVYESL